MQAIVADATYVELALALGVGAAAVLVWKWRRGVANRRIAKGLRSYTATAQVLS